MNKSTKGALAAAAAGALLLGGAGTLAFWTDDTTVDAGSISSGSLDLSAVTCASSWTHTETDTAVTLVVPGDTITKQCTGTLTLVGEHIGATVALDPASISNDDAEGTLADEITAEAVMTSPAATVSAPGTYNVVVDINVTFDGAGGTNDSMTDTAVLDELQLVATQTHDGS